MKRFLLCILLALAAVGAAIVSQSLAVKYEKAEYRIVMRDSVALHTTVYKPRWGRNHPILVQRTPYSCAPYGEAFSEELKSNYLMKSFVRRGYILVFQDVRGRFMSEGEFENVRPATGSVNEVTDSYDTVEWLVNNIEGNNGKVGFYGCSYPGFYAMYAGLCGHPAVKAVSPQAPVTDWFMGDDVHHNGVMMIADAFNLMPMLSHTNHTPTTEWLPTRQHDTSPDQYTFFRGATRDSLHSVIHPSSFWDDMSEHPDYDEWWQSRDLRQYLYDVVPAVLVVGGTFDAEDCFGAWNSYKAISTQSPDTDCRLVIGPWAHGAWRNDGAERLGDFDFGEKASCRYYADNFEIPFFEYHLRGRGSVVSLPKVSVFLSGSNEWVDGLGSKSRKFYLDGNTLAEQHPTDNSYRIYTSDPSNPVPYDSQTVARRRDYMVANQDFTDGRADVLEYTTEPLKSDISVAGGIKVTLDISASTTDADFAVRVIDLYPQDGGEKAGYQMLVRADIMRARYRESFSTPIPLVPDRVTRVEFELPGVAHTFKAGHQLQVCVQSSWYPLAERSPQQFVNLWECSADDFIESDIKIYNSSYINFSEL